MEKKETKLIYVSQEQIDQVNAIINEFITDSLAPENIISKIGEISLKRENKLLQRIELLKFAHAKIFTALMEERVEKGMSEQSARTEIIKEAQIRKMSHYHHLSGSTAPPTIASRQDEFFNDPTSAKMKFETEIPRLAQLVEHHCRTAKAEQ